MPLRLIDTQSSSGRVIELTHDLRKSSRISEAEARIFEALAGHRDLPQSCTEANSKIDHPAVAAWPMPGPNKRQVYRVLHLDPSDEAA